MEVEETEASVEMGAELEEDNLSEEEKFALREHTVAGRWDKVIDMYDAKRNFHKVEINKSRGTALHVAVNDGKLDVVRSLVGAIIKHECPEALKLKNEEGDINIHIPEALKLKNEEGDTPLHLAAARGLVDMCKCIIGEKGERKELINIDNNEGETPLFHAALTWQKQTFVYLCSLMPADGYFNYTKDLVRKNGDSILHCAIRREFLDLALIIMADYPNLHDIQNKEGFSPLKLLGTRPSAFKSGSKMRWWNRILYHCIPIETLDVEKVKRLYMEKADTPKQNEKLPENYRTCYELFSALRYLAEILFEELAQKFSDKSVSGNVGARQNVPEKYQHHISMPERENKEDSRQNGQKSKEEGSHEPVPGNYTTCLLFVKYAYMYILGLAGVGVDGIKKMKQKHVWSRQLLSKFMERAYESYMGSGGQPTDGADFADNTVYTFYKKQQEDKDKQNVRGTSSNHQILDSKPGIDKQNETSTKQAKQQENNKTEVAAVMIDRMETAILAAARYGIVEMVNEILSNIPSAIHETSPEKKNVLLVAVENRKPLVVEALRDRFTKNKETEVIFNNLIQGVDDQENTVLHLAAKAPSDKAWQISGAALQMMWDIKWFQYIKDLVPDHFTIRTNKEEKTAGEIFKGSHEDLVKNGREWLKDTSESCSLVAALLAAVSFATASNVPGGNNSDTGKPALDGKPAFEAFAIASLIGLCFSVTALIMFLSILTSRKEVRDFSKNLPRKLVLGLSSLFISICAMFVSFCAGHFFVLANKYKGISFLIYAITCLPVSFYAVAQFPLYIDLVKAIVKKVPEPADKGDDL